MKAGNYSISEDNIILTDMKNRVRNLKYSKEDDSLTEALNDTQDKIATYVRISEEEKKVQENTEKNIVGDWKADKAFDSDGKDVELSMIWGTGIKLENKMTFTGDGKFQDRIGIQETVNDDTYSVHGTVIRTWGNLIRNFAYDESEDNLTEYRTIGDNTYKIIYVRIK